ncbi:hypothetical protein SEA_GUEY18_94 [Gordonia phage Guey18]|nr:hypothetical protein SEA_GUEY18_94 [Gordonia phage Guey18]
MIINEFRCDRCKIAGYKENSLDEGPRGWFIVPQRTYLNTGM